MGAGRDVEQRCLARIRIADQRDVDGSARYVLKTVDRFVPERSAGRKSRPRRSAARQRNFDQFRLAFAQGDAVTHDFVFDGIRQRGVFDDPHRFAANESHFCDPVAKRAVSEHFGDDPFFRRLQFRQAFIYDFFFHLSSDREIFSGQRYATGGFRKIPEAGEKGFPSYLESVMTAAAKIKQYPGCSTGRNGKRRKKCMYGALRMLRKMIIILRKMIFRDKSSGLSAKKIVLLYLVRRVVLHAAGDNFNLILLNEEMSKKRFVGLLLIGALLFVFAVACPRCGAVVRRAERVEGFCDERGRKGSVRGDDRSERRGD